MAERPRAATTIPALFLAAALGGGWVFESGQERDGKAGLHAQAKRVEDAISAREPRAAVQLSRVSVEGGEGVTTFEVFDRRTGARLGAQDRRWRRLPTGAWEESGEPRFRAASPDPLRRR